MNKPKRLNSPEPIHRLMGETGYSGTANSTHETSKLASRGISAVAGLAALVGSAYSVMAQDVQPIAYKDTNLEEHGVPNFEGMKPYRTKFLDKTSDIPGQETRIDAYRVGSGFVAAYSVDGKRYSIGYDLDGKKPLDGMLLDSYGSGEFKQIPIGQKFAAPSWITK